MFDTIFIIRVIALLLAVGLAAYYDNKTGYIFDWISLPLIVIGLIINLFTFYWLDVLSILLIALAIYVFGYIAYYYGKIGGGDIKLFLGIHMILPYLGGQLFILWAIIASSLLSVLFVSVTYIIKLYGKIKITKELLEKKKGKIIQSLLFFVLFLALCFYAVAKEGLPEYLYLTIPPMFFGCIVMVLEDEVKEFIYLRRKPISKLEEGDVLAIEFCNKDLLKETGLEKRAVLEIEDIEKIKKLGYKSIPIYDYLPRFGIYILLGVVSILIYNIFII
jgi:Flp pilus assembly protein protease CpaA